MSEQFSDQGGAATMEPNKLRRWLTSQVMTRAADPERFVRNRKRIENLRKIKRSGHVVEYFHQIEDGYSHLAAQVLKALSERYDIELKCHLVTGPKAENLPEPELLLQLSRYDASLVAPHYGLRFPDHEITPSRDLCQKAKAILSAQNPSRFVDIAGEVGEALWSCHSERLDELSKSFGAASEREIHLCHNEGDARIKKLKHYSGAMFYYGGEWYWGVDRLYHLEKRLIGLGLDRTPGRQLIAPRPDIQFGTLKDDGSLTLEIYPSLRSPYTAISFDRSLELAKSKGVNLSVKPVLPMVMRGVPLTREKGFYVFTDAAREAEALSSNFGKFYDPIGEPVRQCFSLYPWACDQGRGNELISSFLCCAFSEGINTNNTAGLKAVVERAGLDWSLAKNNLGNEGWQHILESNRNEMYAAGLWGVPSYRLIDKDGTSLLRAWGQDRLWILARTIELSLAGNSDDGGRW